MKHLDCFAGAGGFSLALKQAIWEVETIGFSEIDKFAIQTYQKNFPWVPNFWDISKIDIASLPDFDLLTGGFPCQDVSVAGKQNLEWGRTVLVEYLLQMLEIKKPKYFVFENVKGLMSKKFNTFRNSIFDRIHEAGYEYDVKVLNTRDFWIPQNRERVFIVGSYWKLDFEFPRWEELQVFLKDILEIEVDEKFYLTGDVYEKLKKFESNARLYDVNWISPTLNTMQWGHRQPKIITNVNPSWKWMNWQVYDSDNISPTLTTNKWEGIKIIERPHWKNKGSIRSDGICPTIRCQVDGNTLVTNYYNKKILGDTVNTIWTHMWATNKQWIQVFSQDRIRKLTPIECERLQGFLYNWTAGVSNSQRYKQMWNAISINPVREIFRNLIKIF